MALTIRSAFDVAAPPDVVWKTLVDIEAAAPCFPGARLGERLDDGSYQGSFVVKLGPMTFNFAGKFRIAEQHDAERKAVIAANGSEVKGRGGADARIDVVVNGDATASRVEVVSDVNLSGAVAQYGRGSSMIEALSQQLLNQFSKNIAGQITVRQAAIEAESRVTPSDGTPVDAPAPVADLVQPSPSRPVAAAPVQPLDGGSLVFGALWAMVKRGFQRLFGTTQRN